MGIGLVMALLLRVVTLSAQTGELRFDVVSIKSVASPRGSRGRGDLLQHRPGSVRATGITAQRLIGLAFPADGAVRLPSRIAGGPDWLATRRFEFVATLPGDVPEQVLTERLPALLQSVLSDRFRLRGHMEMRPVPIYALVRSRRDGSLGPLLRPGNPRADPWSGSAQDYISAINMTIDALAGRLTTMNAAGRVVLDRTGLEGGFDVDLYWSPARTLVTGAVPPEVDGPSLFTAVQEQLGLKLEPRTELQDVFVVDHIEPPTPN